MTNRAKFTGLEFDHKKLKFFSGLNRMDGKGNFTRKAMIFKDEFETYYLMSSGLFVCCVDVFGEFIRLHKRFDATTIAHINAFRVAMGLEQISIRQFSSLPVIEKIAPSE